MRYNARTPSKGEPCIVHNNDSWSTWNCMSINSSKNEVFLATPNVSQLWKVWRLTVHTLYDICFFFWKSVFNILNGNKLPFSCLSVCDYVFLPEIRFSFGYIYMRKFPWFCASLYIQFFGHLLFYMWKIPHVLF